MKLCGELGRLTWPLPIAPNGDVSSGPVDGQLSRIPAELSIFQGSTVQEGPSHPVIGLQEERSDVPCRRAKPAVIRLQHHNFLQRLELDGERELSPRPNGEPSTSQQVEQQQKPSLLLSPTKRPWPRGSVDTRMAEPKVTEPLKSAVK